MKASLLLCLSLTCACSLAVAEAINLGCRDLADTMIARLAAEGLLERSNANDQRVRAISLELCADAEGSARRQHEADRQDALKNWITQPTGGKAGNERLKRLKR